MRIDSTSAYMHPTFITNKMCTHSFRLLSVIGKNHGKTFFIFTLNPVFFRRVKQAIFGRWIFTNTFDLDRSWAAHGEPDVAELVRIMASRRSCRSYTEEPVDRRVLQDLVKVGVTAPSATCSQKWTFTLLPTRDASGSELFANFAGIALGSTVAILTNVFVTKHWRRVS